MRAAGAIGGRSGAIPARGAAIAELHATPRPVRGGGRICRQARWLSAGASVEAQKSGARTAEPVALEAAPSSAGPAATRSATPIEPVLADPSSPSLWTRFVHFAYRYLGSAVYPAKAHICNCGIDVGVQIPRPDLVKRDDIEVNSREWRMQIYGAALYWHMATTPGEKLSELDPDMIRGKDVLEVACMRGGGARYLAEVAGPRRYVATDNVQEHVDLAKKLHLPFAGLEFELADAHDLQAIYPSESFDFVLCIQASATFGDMRKFFQGAWHVLRPGGKLMICDALTRDTLKIILDVTEELGFATDAMKDISRGVNAVGLCQVPWGLEYTRVVVRKV